MRLFSGGESLLRGSPTLSPPTLSADFLPTLAILRSTAIELKGSRLGSVPVDRIVRGIEEVLQAAVAGRFQMATKAIPLSKSNGFGRAILMYPASCSRLARNASDSGS